MIRALSLSLSISLLLCSTSSAQEKWTVRADTVYTAAGDPIAGGVVVIQDGKITAVGTGGGGGDVLEVAAVTPGMIDLSCRIHTNYYSVEQTTETSIDMSVSEALDPFSYRWERELRAGVTTVMVSPFDVNVLGGFGVILKTGGEPNIAARTVKEEACLRGCIGPQPSGGNFAPRGGPPTTFYARRPTTRMGVEWVFRKTYYDLLNNERLGTTVDERTAAHQAVLKRTLAGDLPVVLKAKATQDVRTAIYLKEEFGIPNMILDAAAEAWKEPELVLRSGVGLIFPPYPKDGRVPDGTVNDSYFFALDSAAKFHALGIPIALSGGGAADVGQRLGRQAGFAMRGGLPFDAALAAVTINPARMMGVDDRVGSIEVGKDADLVLWNGKPFEPTSAIIGVLLDGVLVVDPRSQQ